MTLATLGILCTNSGLPNTTCRVEIGLLSILPKKGDLSNPEIYRGIMMLEVAYKIVADILLTVLKPIKESVQLDPEC